MKPLGRAVGPLLISSLLYLAQTVHGVEPKQSEFLSLFSTLPLNDLEYELQNLYLFDFEHAFFYMQSNWLKLESLPMVFGPCLPPNDEPITVEPTPTIDPPEEDCSPCCCPLPCCYSSLDKVCSTLILRHIDPGGIGYSHGYTTIEGLIFPLKCQETRWPFIDLRVHYFNDNEWAGNLGFGPRFLTCTNVVYGVNTYFDFRTYRSKFFPQVGVGLERLSSCFDIRINGYFPIKRNKTEKRCHFTAPGGFVLEGAGHRVAPIGVDMEIGRNIRRNDCFRLYTAIGPYYYAKAGREKSFVGGRLRLLVNILYKLTFEGILTYDSHYKTRVQGGLSVNFPLDCCPQSDPCQDVLSQPVWRNEIIPLEKYCQWNSNF